MEVAYCESLGRWLTITDIRREYYAQPEENREQFDLVCSDLDCRQPNGQRTQISACNGYVPYFTDHLIKRAPHLRLFPNQLHHKDCAWSSNTNQSIDSLPFLLSLNTNNINPISPFVTTFYRPLNNENPTETINNQLDINNTDDTQILKRRSSTTNTLNNIYHAISTTKFLDKLVGSYLYAREMVSCGKMTEEYFSQLSFEIPKEGHYFYKYFFRLARKVYNLNKFTGVHIANCSIKKKYDGWFLNLFDEINNKPSFIFLKNSVIDEYKYKNTILDILNQCEKCKYIKAYFLNPILIESDDRIKIKLNSLEDLVLHLGTPIND